MKRIVKICLLIAICNGSFLANAYVPLGCTAYLDCGDGNIYCAGDKECSASSSGKSVTCDGRTLKC